MWPNTPEFTTVISVENTGLLGPAPAPAGTAEVALSAQRLAVLQHVRTHGPVSVADTATALALHPNTVRTHLEALTAREFIERTAAPDGRRGRPAARYRPSATDPTAQVRAFATLATVLADQLARISPHPERDAEEAGVAWGRDLVGQSAQHGGPYGDADPRDVVVEALARLGFAPDPPDAAAPRRGLALRRCPLLDAARRNPDVVCRVHQGIVVGMLDHLQAPVGTELVPFAEPGACRLRMPPRRRDTGRTSP